MAERPRADLLAWQVYQRLVGKNAAGALALVDEALLAAADRPALRARLRSWQAQALLDLRRPQEASQAALRGVRAAQAAADPDGVSALRKLQAQALAQAAALKVAPPDERTPVGLAAAALDAGRTQAGELLALGALAQARAVGDPREIVLALLALARLPHRTEAALQQAQQVADAAGDMNLVTAVSKAASAAGVTFAPHIF